MYLRISQATSNDLYLKVTDLSDTNPFYLFRFVDEVSKDEYLVELVDNEPGNDRFSMFTLVLPTDLDLPAGEYKYYVYRSEASGDEDYSAMLELTMSVCEVITIFDEGTTYEPTGTDIIYQP
jgi:hypothetical protein